MGPFHHSQNTNELFLNSVPRLGVHYFLGQRVYILTKKINFQNFDHILDCWTYDSLTRIWFGYYRAAQITFFYFSYTAYLCWGDGFSFSTIWWDIISILFFFFFWIFPTGPWEHQPLLSSSDKYPFNLKWVRPRYFMYSFSKHNYFLRHPCEIKLVFCSWQDCSFHVLFIVCLPVLTMPWMIVRTNYAC